MKNNRDHFLNIQNYLTVFSQRNSIENEPDSYGGYFFHTRTVHFFVHLFKSNDVQNLRNIGVFTRNCFGTMRLFLIFFRFHKKVSNTQRQSFTKSNGSSLIRCSADFGPPRVFTFLLTRCLKMPEYHSFFELYSMICVMA